MRPMADGSPMTDFSTNADTKDKNHKDEGATWLCCSYLRAHIIILNDQVPSFVEAAEYGRTMGIIRQRTGHLLMAMEKRYGKSDDGGELAEKELIKAERNAGFISDIVADMDKLCHKAKVKGIH